MEIVLFILIILSASILQTSTGFGFSILATPLLLFLFEPAEAIQINLILSLVISLSLIISIRKEVDYGTMKRFCTGSTVGLLVGILFFLTVEISSLELAVGTVTLLFTFLLIFNFRVLKTKRKDSFVGSVSGALTSSIGMPGPPLLLYMSGTETRAEVIRSTTLAFYLYIYFVSLIAQIIFAGTSPVVLTSSLWGLPVVFLGLYLGRALFKHINQRIFRIITYIILIITGISLLADSFGWL